MCSSALASTLDSPFRFTHIKNETPKMASNRAPKKDRGARFFGRRSNRRKKNGPCRKARASSSSCCDEWSRKRESNPPEPAWEAGAIPLGDSCIVCIIANFPLACQDKTRAFSKKIHASFGRSRKADLLPKTRIFKCRPPISNGLKSFQQFLHETTLFDNLSVDLQKRIW